MKIVALLALVCGVALLLVAPASNAAHAFALLFAATGGYLWSQGRMATAEPVKEQSNTPHISDTVADRRLSARTERLLEATMAGMREGMVVLDQDMRVVLS